MAWPKILIGSPTYEGKDYCLTDFATATTSIVYPNMEFLFVDNSKTEDFSKKMNAVGLPTIWKPSNLPAAKKMAEGSNILRDKVINEKFDFLLYLETDIIIPQCHLLMLLSYFRAHKHRVLSSLYSIYGGAYRERCVRTIYDDGDTSHLRFMGDFSKILQPLMHVYMAGLGCTLIHRSVLEKIKFRAGITSHPDSLFAEDCFKNGFFNYLYTKDTVQHLNKGDWAEKYI